LWEPDSGLELAVFEGHKGSVQCVAWRPDGTRLASGGDDGTVRLWEAASGLELAVLEGHKRAVRSLCWSPDGTRLVSGGIDGNVLLWDEASRCQLEVLSKGFDGIFEQYVSGIPDGIRAASAGDDGTLRMRDATGRGFMWHAGHAIWVNNLWWSSDSTRLAVVGFDGIVRLSEAESGLELAVLKGHKGRVKFVSWSPDTSRVASGGNDGTVRLWEVESGLEVAVLEGHKGFVMSVSRSLDGSRMASGGHDGTVRLWEVESDLELAVLKGHSSFVECVSWSADGSRVASGGGDGTVRVWDSASGLELAVLAGHSGIGGELPMWVSSVCWSPDGTRLVSGGTDGNVLLWDVVSSRQLAVLEEGFKRWVECVGWSPDGSRVASGGDDGTVRLWEAASGLELAVFEGHKGSVQCVAWRPDGTRLASGGNDGTVRLWEVESGLELVVFEGHKGSVMSVGWSPDGGVWAAADGFGLVLFWSADDAATPLPRGGDGRYTNAKVLVVGESGAGKTGLTRRLATGVFEDSEASTVGAWATQWPLPQPAAAGAPEREIWLWDFGGQADQRLIHQLFLDRAALVLLLFNAERDEVIEGLRDWQVALQRSLDPAPPQLLVAARVDAGFNASRSRLQAFAAETGSRLLETSAREGSGCDQLLAAIQEAIAWDQLTRHTSPPLFRWIKAEILRLRDQGDVLLTYKELRERLRQRLASLEAPQAGLHAAAFDDATLRTVLGLLDGPGVLKQLDFGDYVLLKPEWLGVYGQGVVQALRQADPQLGTLPVGAIAAANLPIPSDQQRLPPAEEQLLLAELERQLQQRRICLRLGGQLVFPSHCGRERPASPALPPRFMSYAVRGWLNDIYATLVVTLAETRVFELQELWRDAAAFQTPVNPSGAGGKGIALQLQRHNATEGTITLHTSEAFSRTEQAQFAHLIQQHLGGVAETVERRRHWLCPHCHAPKGNEAVLMTKLARDGEAAQVICDACDRRFSLYDDLERLLADPMVKQRAEAISNQEPPQLTARRKGKLLVLEVGSRLTEANQKWLEIPGDEDDGLDLQLEFTDDDGNGSGRFLYLQLKAGTSHLRRRADGREFFAIKKPRWVTTWTQQPYPVMLVIGQPADELRSTSRAARDPLERAGRRSAESFPFDAPDCGNRTYRNVRWMEITSVLQRELDVGRRPEDIKQIEFDGEALDLASVLRWRQRMLSYPSRG
jgi:WD40 repeat protein